jgi:hypothetical protein
VAPGRRRRPRRPPAVRLRDPGRPLDRLLAAAPRRAGLGRRRPEAHHHPSRATPSPRKRLSRHLGGARQHQDLHRGLRPGCVRASASHHHHRSDGIDHSRAFVDDHDPRTLFDHDGAVDFDDDGAVDYDHDGAVDYDDDGAVDYDDDGAVDYDDDGAVDYDDDGAVDYDHDGAVDHHHSPLSGRRRQAMGASAGSATVVRCPSHSHCWPPRAAGRRRSPGSTFPRGCGRRSWLVSSFSC